jgi:hypothetical protein
LVSIGFLAGCHETPHAYYANASDAVKDGAIARGWLPSVLDSNVTEISESHDLDSNQGIADFRYTPELIRKLQRNCIANPTGDGHPMFRCGAFEISLDPAQLKGRVSH